MEELRNLQQIYSLAASRFNQYEGKDFVLPEVFKEQVKEINSNLITYNEYSAIIETRGNQNGVLNIFLPNQWFYIASYFTDLYNELQKYKKEALKVVSKERLRELNGASLTESEIERVNRLSLNDTSKRNLVRFMTDYSWWSGAKTIDRGDFYVSPILNSARLVNASQSFVADLCAFLANKQELVQAIISGVGDTVNGNKHPQTSRTLQQIFYGAPGTGKSHFAKGQTIGKSVIRTTFHPDSDYSTFVGAYKPTTIDEEVVNIIGREAVNVKNPDGTPRTEKKIIYEFVPQAFLQAYVKAWKLYAEAEEGTPKEQFLIIEEINRGNCAQIFGDIFQLLDRGDEGYSDYYIKADNDMQKYLKKEFNKVDIHAPSLCDKSADEISKLIKEGEILILPNNLYIWATMNTSDQSLFPIDSAFKRRWEWKYMPIANEGKGWTVEVGGNTYDWWTFLEAINKKIEDATYSEDKKLGYFFCKAKDGVIDAKTFVGKVLFYLWNDVFKDTDLAESLFTDEYGKKSFDKFYIPMGQGETEVNTNRVIEFMEKLEVSPLVEGEFKEEEDTEEEDDFVDENLTEGTDISPKGTKDTSVYSVNGVGRFRKKNVPHRVVSVYVEQNPDKNAAEIVRAWNALGTMVTVVLTEDEYNRKKEKTTDSIFETRYNEVRLNNGEKVYVFNQFNPERINNLVSKVNAQPWGIRIEKVEE